MGRGGRYAAVGVLLGLAAAACGDDGAGSTTDAADLTIEPVATDLPVWGGSIVHLDGVLLAVAHDEMGGDGDLPLWSSTDGGASWDGVELPGAPDDTSMGDPMLQVLGDVALFSTSNPGYLWVSEDGRTWQGGAFGGRAVDEGGFPEIPEDRTVSFPEAWVDGDRVLVPLDVPRHLRGTPPTASADPSGSGRVTVDESGGTSAAAAPEAGQVLVSDDRGVTWQLEECPGGAVERPGLCRGESDTGGPQFRDGSISTDGGETWSEMTVDLGSGPMDISDPGEGVPRFAGAVQSEDSGWLGAAHADDHDSDYAYLLRSPDGVAWEVLIDEDRCRAGESSAAISVPVPVADHWLVSHSCDSLLEFEFTELLLVSPDGHTVESLDDLRSTDMTYHQPLVVGDEVLVPASSVVDDGSLGRATLFRVDLSG